MASVTCRVRDDVLAVHSSLSPVRAKYMAHSLNVPSEASWRASWEKELFKLAGEFRARYYVWISLVRRVAITIEQPPDGRGRHYRVVHRDHGCHHALTAEVLERMKHVPEHPEIGKVWFFSEMPP